MSYDLVGDDEILGSIGAELLAGLFDGEDDEVGADALDMLVSGSGNSDIVGASAAQKRAARKRALLNKIRARGASAVVNRPLNTKRRLPLGFVPTTVLAASPTASIPAAPQNLFKATRLCVPSDVAFDFGIIDVKVGNQSQLVQAVEVPAAMFTEVAQDTFVDFDTAEVGNQISIQVRNKAGVDVDFSGALMGTVAKAG